ncbi:hypothetical protein ACJIZ3_010385 [Penstemon smallii]|uniref:F-box domain-containing protein n=1 Tax=Penstemon smallii TaxID=265156 RepID=A0ABD3TF64_9LAMI
MALNYSRRPTYSFEDTFVSPMRVADGYLVEGVSEKNGEGYSTPCHASQGEADTWNFNFWRDRVDRCSLPESTSKDIVDLLPSDPFEMDIQNTFTAITGYYQGLLSGWNLFQNNALSFQQFQKLNMGQDHEKQHMSTHSFSNIIHYDEKLNAAGSRYGVEKRDTGEALPPYDFRFQPSFSSELQTGERVEGDADFEGMPHEALFFALGYLGVKDLLSVERVCRSLCSTVHDDPLLWMSIHLNKTEITDDFLVQLARRAQGKLQCLSLVECSKVTGDGLRRVLETNPLLTKLCVPGCTNISIEVILNNVKMCNSNRDARGIKHLRIAGISDLTHEIFEQLKLLLGAADTHENQHFYHRENSYLPYDDDRAIDVDMCPRCKNIKLVYDCPYESCKIKDKGSAGVCRGCIICIPRCAQCGRCFANTEFMENFCLDLICSYCFKLPLEYQDRQEENGGSVLMGRD